jgi:hypothetical protein
VTASDATSELDVELNLATTACAATVTQADAVVYDDSIAPCRFRLGELMDAVTAYVDPALAELVGSIAIRVLRYVVDNFLGFEEIAATSTVIPSRGEAATANTDLFDTRFSTTTKPVTFDVIKTDGTVVKYEFKYDSGTPPLTKTDAIKYINAAADDAAGLAAQPGKGGKIKAD